MPPKSIQTVINTLEAHGFSAYAVGGCVRDTLLHTTPHDWDICSNAPAETVMQLFEQVIPTGIKHGTVTVMMDAEAVEVTTFRTESGYQDHRHPAKVEFVQTLEEDLKRRDFTINAMCFAANGSVIDLYGGQEDLKNHLIRCVGDPDHRFKEDALRMLRAMRFASTLGFSIEKKTGDAIHRNKELLQFVSKERIQMELSKMLVGKNIEEVLLCFTPIITEIIPELWNCLGFPQHSVWHNYDVWTHMVKTVSGSEPILEVRLAALLHDIAKPQCFQMDEDGHGHFHGHGPQGAVIADDILRRLRFDNQTREHVVWLIKTHDTRLAADKKTVAKWVSKYGEEAFLHFLMLRYADIMAQSDHEREPRIAKIKKLYEIYLEVVEEHQALTLKDMDINGHDLLKLGYKGPELGKKLQELLDLVLEEKLKNQHETLLEYCKKI